MAKEISILKALNESKMTKIEDYKIGKFIHFKDGEVWQVVKSGLRGSDNRKHADEVTIKPFNKLAKEKNVSLAIDVNLNYLNSNVIKIVDECLDESTTIKIEKLSDIDHTRIIKWMNGQFDSNKYNMKKSGSGFEIDTHKLSKIEQEDLMNYLKSQDYIHENEVNERVQIKRKYGEYSAHNVNVEAPIRNRVVEFVGKRFVTNEELKNFLTKLEEDRGNAIDQRKWFGRNMRYFESTENRGQQVWSLSKFGKRVLEQIIKAKSQKQSNTMNESIGLFKFDSINESVDVKYWTGYHEKSSKINRPSDIQVQQEVEASVEKWNDNNENGKENEVTSAGEKKVLKIAKEFAKAAGWISSDVIDAIIAQES